MSDNGLNVKEVSEFLRLPESTRWQVLFFGLIATKKTVARLEKLGWGILLSIVTHGVLTMMQVHI